MSQELLIVFVKNPELGRVKTRLAKAVGEEKALAIYFALLSRCHALTEQLSCDVAIFYDRYIDTEDQWDNHRYQKYKQE
ncbi:MAG: glycosyltransferase, partial [Fulvivirga sp.]|nr:glycosyltransferase [Fulvivirga sp.]